MTDRQRSLDPNHTNNFRHSGDDPPDGEDPAVVISASPTTVAAPAYAELAKIVLTAQPLGAVLTRVADLALQLVPGADDVSVTLIERGKARSVAFCGQLAAALDERQYEAGYGPCMDAAVTGQIIEIKDTANDTTYRNFASQAARAGIKHTLSVGLPILQETSGALNIYNAADRPFEQADRDVATTFASYAAVAVTNAAVYAGALNQVEHLRIALESRAVIDQAKGIIMRDRRCGPDEAFNVLRDASMRANRKLRDVAVDVVENAVRR